MADLHQKDQTNHSKTYKYAFTNLPNNVNRCSDYYLLIQSKKKAH